MKFLNNNGIKHIFHFMPLHYLPFVARSNELKSKPLLAAEGFELSHFRSTSAHIDATRGFGNYVHLSTIAEPPILAAKLNAGFPHIGLELSTADYPQIPYDLCRFNIAKTRFLRRNGKKGFDENSANGRYYGDLQIPIARSDEEKALLLDSRQGDPMIEVLVDERLTLKPLVIVRAYCETDRDIAHNILNRLNLGWAVQLHPTQRLYKRDKTYGNCVEKFIDTALDDPCWRGNGLEFDRV